MYVHTFVGLLKESSIHPVQERLASSPGSPIFSKHSTECFKGVIIESLLPRMHAQGVKYSFVSLLSTKYHGICVSCKCNNRAQEQCMHIMHVLSAHAHSQCFILGKDCRQHKTSSTVMKILNVSTYCVYMYKARKKWKYLHAH